jgi:hypothetical protein
MLSPCLAHAGAKLANPVSIYSSVAYGGLGDARANSDPDMQIGCSVNVNSTGVSASCYAATSSASAYCSTTNPNMIATYNCLVIGTGNGSYYSPKQP